MNTKLLLVISIIGIAFISMPANAEITFNETFSFGGGGTNSETTSSTGTGLITAASNVGSIYQLYNDFDDQKVIQKYIIPNGVYLAGASPITATLTAAANGINANFTSFSATVGGQAYGTGNIGWVRTSGSNFRYEIIFDTVQESYARTLTGQQEIVLTYNKNTFSDYISSETSNFDGSGCTYNYFRVYVSTHKTASEYRAACAGNAAQSAFFTFSDQATLTFNNLSGSFGWVNLSKSLYNIRLQINDSQNNLYYDVTSTTNDAQYINKSNGIGANVRSITAASWANRTLVDASGDPVTPTPAPTPLPPGAGGSVSGQISFDYLTPNLQSNWGINTSISDTNFSTFTTYYITARDPVGAVVSGFPVSFSNQTYVTGRMWKFTSLGTWNATLEYCNTLDITCSNALGVLHELDTASVLINQQVYAYNVTANANSYYTGQVINVSISNPSPFTAFFNVFLSVGGQNVFEDFPIAANTDTYILYNVTGDMLNGEWEANLNTQMNGVGKVAYDTFTIGLPAANSNVLGLRWDIQNYLGRNNALFYTSNYNISYVNVYKVFPGTNATQLFDNFSVPPNTTSSKSYLMDTVGTWNASIRDQNNSANIIYANMTVLSNLSIGCLRNLPDYVCWDKQTYSPGDPFTIDYKATNLPKIAWQWTFGLRVIVLDPENRIFYNRSLIQSPPDATWEIPTAGTVSWKFKSSAQPGYYHAVIIKDGTPAASYLDGTVLADSYAVLTTAVPGVTTTPPTGAEANSQMQSNLNTLMSSAAFWGVLIFAFVMIAGASYHVQGSHLGMIGFILANVEAVAGLWAPYTWYVLIIVWIGAGIFYTVGSKTSGTD